MLRAAAVDLRSGFADVIASGTAIGFDAGSEISVDLRFDDGTRLLVNFSFADDASSPLPRLEQPATSKTEIDLRLVNFNNALGQGNEAPVKLGLLGGLSLYLNFRVYALGKSPKTLNYAFYVRDDKRLAEIQKKALLSMRGEGT